MKCNLGFRDGKGEGMMMMQLWPIGWFYRHIGLYLYTRPAASTLYDTFGTTQSGAARNPAEEVFMLYTLSNS